MGYLSCNGERAIATCDPYNWDCKKITSNEKPIRPIKIRTFSYAELVKATDGFSADSFLGKGSHGSVYKAILDDGKLIAAVKRTKLLNPTIGFDFNPSISAPTPAENEIEILSRVQNPYLVNLIGFCNDSDEKKNQLLVVEYMHNGSLYDLLHKRSKSVGWTRRVRFALQVAKAVQALHCSSPPVIHRDIKSSNVLIDDKWNARLSDFGLALRGHVEDVRVKCTPPAGTLGYLDPGYLAPGDLSAKNDVFSFGILLLEIISGRNAIDVNYSPPSIVDWAVPLIKRRAYQAVCDNRIEIPADPTWIRHVLVLAGRCVRATAHKRPEMEEVVETLAAASKRLKARTRAPREVWGNLRRRVGRVDGGMERRDMDALVGGVGVAGAREDTGKIKKVAASGSARRGKSNRKVSNVSNADGGTEASSGTVSVRNGSGGQCQLAGDRVVRSRSVGSQLMVEVVGPMRKSGGHNQVEGPGVPVQRSGPVVRGLSKSRSVGFLRGAHTRVSIHYKNNSKTEGFEFEDGWCGSGLPLESEVSKRFIGVDKYYENKLLETPLVSL